MGKKLLSIVVLSVALVALAMPAGRPAVAAPSSVTFTVNSALDQIGDNFCHTVSDTCTLRAAVIEADKSGVDATIMVPAGVYSLTIKADLTDNANTGDLNLTTPMSGDPQIRIVGAGAATTIIDGNLNDRVLSVDTGRAAAISGLTLRGGYLAGGADGGGIFNLGTLTLDNSTVSGNQTANGGGGGLANWHNLTLTNSTIGPNNTAAGRGGGIVNFDTLTVDRSTVYFNSANFGGGIYNSSLHNLTLVNSTLSQNDAVHDGGGIFNYGTANVYNTTLVFNSADTESPTSSAAGGVKNVDGATFNLRNILLAGNYASLDQNATADCTGTINSYGQNLIGVFGDPASSCIVNASTTGTLGVVNSLDHIGPLQDNGGPTWTHALLTGSNAIDWGDPSLGCLGPSSVLTTDQRGFPREALALCDIGAFEYGAKGPQTIAFGPLANKTFGDPSFSVSATASSGLAVTFTAAGQCNVSGSTVTLAGAGSCTVTAHQAGDSNYNAASDVPQSFTISASSPKL